MMSDEELEEILWGDNPNYENVTGETIEGQSRWRLRMETESKMLRHLLKVVCNGMLLGVPHPSPLGSSH